MGELPTSFDNQHLVSAIYSNRFLVFQNMVSLVANNIDGIRKLCQENYVKKLYLFGSAAREKDFSPVSDVDFLCYYQPFQDEAELMARHDYWWDLQSGLSELLGCKVDVVSAEVLINPYLIQSINQDKTLLYAA